MITDAELIEAADAIYDGWFAADGRIDWHEFLDRLEDQTDVDLGCNMQSPRISETVEEN